MTQMQLLWRTGDGGYALTPFKTRLPGGTYCGSLRQLADRYRAGGREWFLSCLPGLPAEILAAVERHAAAVERALRRLDEDAARQQAEEDVWAKPKPVTAGAAGPAAAR